MTLLANHHSSTPNMTLLLVSILISSFAFSISESKEEIPSTWEKMEACKRKCTDEPKICYLRLTIQRYVVMGPPCRGCETGNRTDCDSKHCVTADGYHKAIITANRDVPAPAIEVCQHDTVIVDVINGMGDQTTSIHWHGISQKGSQHYDGVPFVTQCPINPGNTFRYIFRVPDCGTYFYHSHTGVQKLDGFSGALIVRCPKKFDMYSHLFDFDEHVMFVQDWTHIPGEHLVNSPHLPGVGQTPETYLINGMGAYYDETKNISLPIAEFVVKPNKKYRFRLIGSTCTVCAVRITFEGHRLTAISADGDLKFKPFTCDSIVLNSADRFDVIVQTDQPIDKYYIFAQGFGPTSCNRSQYAILRYENSNSSKAKPPLPSSNNMGVVLNDITSGCDVSSESAVCISMLKGVSDAPAIENPDNYHQIDIRLGFHFLTVGDLFNNDDYISYDEPTYGLYVKGLINNVSYRASHSPLLTQYEDIPKENFCSGNCTLDYCSCTQVVTVKRNAVVDFIISFSDALFAHPFHVHGHNVYILHLGSNSSQEARDEIKQKLLNNDIDLSSRPMRDTVSAPVGGLAVIRFIADNIGFWYLHCHFNYHLDAGMVMTLQVGELKDMPQAPQGFPKCGDFKPKTADQLNH